MHCSSHRRHVVSYTGSLFAFMKSHQENKLNEKKNYTNDPIIMTGD